MAAKWVRFASRYPVERIKGQGGARPGLRLRARLRLRVGLRLRARRQLAGKLQAGNAEMPNGEARLESHLAVGVSLRVVRLRWRAFSQVSISGGCQILRVSVKAAVGSCCLSELRWIPGAYQSCGGFMVLIKGAMESGCLSKLSSEAAH